MQGESSDKRNEASQNTLNDIWKKLRPFFYFHHWNPGVISASGEIGNVIEEVVDFSRQINLEMYYDDAQELLDSHIQ
ncbi:hypothetical protein TNCV_1969351 [Trichonephila clavipes]|nr:hypothetical protein TNCV_1969351 [Trichonephila clavipes]